MSIKYIGEEDYIDAIVIGDEGYEAVDENLFVIPKSDLKGLKLSEIKPSISIEVCDQIQEHVILTSSVPFSIQNIGDDRAKIMYMESGTRKYWDGDVGFRKYMETKRDIIHERQNEVGDVSLESYDDDGNFISIHYCTVIESESLELIIQQAEQVAKEIEGALELSFGSPFKSMDNIDNEAEFTMSILVPLFRMMGYSNVKYNHGKREYGKDVTFSRRTEFDEYEYWGVQVKFGDVSGGANSVIDGLIGQAEDAFKMPFYNVYTRTKQRISKLIIAISGKFTENAVEKICEKIESYALKNNIIFMDGDKIQSLAERFRK